MRPQHKRIIVTGFASLFGAVLLAMGLLAAGASAAPNPGPPLTSNPDGPQSANIPYVAWVGENVRVVACDPAIGHSDLDLQFANFSVEDWSGYQFQPPSPDGFVGNNIFEPFDPGPSAFYSSSEPAHREDGCVATIYKSLNPGLARIKVDVRNYADPQEPVFSYQFLVIWLSADKPVLHEAGLEGGGTEVFQKELNLDGRYNLGHFLGDPSGNGEFAPSPFEGSPEEDLGLVQIKVSGNFPVKEEAPLHNILPRNEYTLPADWQELAETLSSSAEATDEPGDDPGLWDIHGSPGLAGEGEETKLGTAPDECEHGYAPNVTSSTDNCNGGSTEFSRVFGDLTSEPTATIGPFDPQLANQTLLSDGRLNEYDAPMPAMRIDLAIAPSNHTLGGVGQLEQVLKSKIYSHDFAGTTSHNNLYNPYYNTYLPATDRPGYNEVSGIAGPDHGADFPGFLNEHPGPYPFWEFVPSYTSEHSNREEEATKCARRLLPAYEEYESPKGHLIETLYTDENGEAYAIYKPGDAFYLNRLVEEGKIEKNDDGGCDLKGVYGQEIGKALISATAIYPYQPVDYPSAQSERPLEKKIVSKWEKEWFVFKKCASSNCDSVRLIVAKAQDIDGRPIKNEKVCFSVGGFAGAEAYYGEPPSDTLKDPEETVFGKGSGKSVLYLGGTGPEEHEAVGELCLHTNDEGLAAIELDNGSFMGVDLAVNFKGEGIIRDHEIEDPPAPGTLAGPEVAAPAAGSPDPGKTSSPVTIIENVIGSTNAGAASNAKPASKAKPLTEAQQLTKALKACRKLPKSKRAACEAKAKKAYAAKAKKSVTKK
jgi:hypothetical protein